MNQRGITLEEVSEERLIALSIDEMEAEAVNLLSAFGRRPKPAFRTSSVEAVRSLVATGAGVALLPDLIHRPWSLEGDKVETRDVSGTLPFIQVGIACRKGAPLSLPAQDFIEIAQRHQALR
jgi:DNA-binding transcriptional LysR family regulator